MTNLSTRYLGLELSNPVVASAGPITQNVEGFRQLADAGVGAIVMYSLFEEQLRHEEALDAMLEEYHNDSYAESLSYFPSIPETDNGMSYRYLQLMERGIAAAPGIPVIASLNGSTAGGWVSFAKQLADAGASALELNIYLVPGDISTTGREVEDRHVEILASVKEAIDIPIAVKLSPYFSSLGEMAQRLVEAGADGLVLFNRFLQPEIDIESLEVKANIELSVSAEGRVPRTWIAALHNRINASLAATSGVATSEDVVRYLLAGADVVMSTSALVRYGADYATDLIAGVENWLERREFESVNQIRGMLAVPKDADASAYERAGYLAALEKAKQTYSPW